MQPPDRLSARFSDLLEGSYDCPDRIVLNAFYPLGFSPGGFRAFWRKLHGDDDKLDNTKPRMRAVVEAVIALAPGPHGFTVRQLASKVRTITGASDRDYQNWAAAYDLAKLRAKGIVVRRPKTQRYQPSDSGLQALAALILIIDKVIRPVLAGAGKPRPRRQPKSEDPSQIHYHALHSEMWKLFGTLGIAA